MSINMFPPNYTLKYMDKPEWNLDLIQITPDLNSDC